MHQVEELDRVLAALKRAAEWQAQACNHVYLPTPPFFLSLLFVPIQIAISTVMAGLEAQTESKPKHAVPAFCQAPFALHLEGSLLLQSDPLCLPLVQVGTHHGEAMSLPGWTDQG
jgi:hypothetical protein